MASVTDKYIFTSILNRGIKQNMIPNKTQEARNWYRSRARRASGVSEARLMSEKAAELTNVVIPGKMYLLMYDAKTKDKLPYWDAFPLIFPIEYTENGFYGLNMHYLQPMLRAQLMDALYSITTDTRYDEKTKVNLSYQALQSRAKSNMYKPCLKRYLRSHIKSKFILIQPQEWDIGLFLPTERFQKATNQQVWADSAKAAK